MVDTYSPFNNFIGITTEHIELKSDSDDNGGSTYYYELPEGATELQDLIEHKKMNFAMGNCFKAVYRIDDPEHNTIRDLNKIIWFANREKKRLGVKDES